MRSDETNAVNEKRALIAGALGVAYPGLGHLYIRSWFRALAWFGLAMATTALVVPESALETARPGGLEAAFRAIRSLPASTVLAVTAVRALSAIDAALIGLRTGSKRGDAGATCSNCGRDLDDDIDFCQWCAAPIEDT